MKRRRHRRKNAVYRTNGFRMKVTSVVLAVCLSVAAGYFTATQLIGPALGLETEPVFFNFINKNDPEKINSDDSVKDKEKQVVQDKIDVQEEQGFALQFGSFSSREGAQQYVDELKKDGIDTRIIEKDGSFKVIGQLFDTKDEARTYKETVSVSGEVFITEIP